MAFTDALRRLEVVGWCVCTRTGEVLKPASGYVVPIRRSEWWSVYARRLDPSLLELFVYSRAPRFAADPSLFLHIAKPSDHYVISTALLANRLGEALRLAHVEHGDEVYLVPDHRAMTRRDVGPAA